MAKRRAEDTLLHHSPSKRCYRSLCSVDMQLETMPPTGGVSLSPPNLLSLLGSRCRKRPYYFEDPKQKEQEEEAAAAGLCRKATNDGSRKHADNVLKVQTSGSFQDGRSSSAHKKRPREDCSGSEIVIPQANDKALNGDASTEDCAYNSFQYWRVPLPELDLSLLKDVDSHSLAKQKLKVKDSSSDAMET